MEVTYQLDFAQELKKCVRCGKCRTSCPVFHELRGESASPRGRLALVKALQTGELEPSEELADRLYTCLLCKTCAVDCPSGVISDEIFVAAREYLAEALGQPLMQRALLRGFLTRPGLHSSASSLMRLYQKSGAAALLDKTHLIEHLPEKAGAAARLLPDVAGKPGRKRLHEVTPAQGEKKYRVSYFLGCATNLLYPQVAEDTVEVLSRNGCEVVTVDAVKCCGMPHLAYGDVDTARELARENLRALADAGSDYVEATKSEVVATSCPTCTMQLSFGLRERGSKADVVHPVQLLARSYRGR